MEKAEINKQIEKLKVTITDTQAKIQKKTLDIKNLKDSLKYADPEKSKTIQLKIDMKEMQLKILVLQSKLLPLQIKIAEDKLNQR